MFIQRIILLAVGMLTLALNATPAVGSVAPDFQLHDQYGKEHSLANYNGKWLVIYFYPKDNTPGCTIEAGKFRDNAKQLADKNAVVLGISLDDVASHLDFSKTLDLNFSLLADENKDAAKSYQVLTNIGPISYAKRETFIIDPEGRIAHHFNEVKPETHTQMVLNKLDELREIYK